MHRRFANAKSNLGWSFFNLLPLRIWGVMTNVTLLAVPTMLKRGYNKSLTSGTVSASGTLGQIIPPSIVPVLIGDIVGVPVGDLFIVMALIFVIGFFLDFIEITFIHVPVLAPIMIEFGFDPAWFCILIAVNLQTSFMTPPFGFSLFYLKAVTPPEITTGHIYRGIIPFVVFQIIGMLIVVFFPTRLPL